MSDTALQPRSAADGLLLPVKANVASVKEAAAACRFSCRGAPEPMSAALGFALPVAPSRAACEGETAALWLGPDEWLLIAPPEARDRIATALKQAAAAGASAAVDVSHRSAGLVVTGRSAARLLASGCPLDLDMAAFPVGMSTRTLLNKAEIILWRTQPDTFRIEVWRSYVPYVAGILAEVIRDLS
jgi:sarcosine oxidase, subunit gamma